MAQSSRRNFLALAGAGTAAVGVAAVLPAGSADAATPKGPTHNGPLVAYVRNAKTGEVAVMAGEHEIVVHDHALATRLGQIAHTAK